MKVLSMKKVCMLFKKKIDECEFDYLQDGENTQKLADNNIAIVNSFSAW